MESFRSLFVFFFLLYFTVESVYWGVSVTTRPEAVVRQVPTFPSYTQVSQYIICKMKVLFTIQTLNEIVLFLILIRSVSSSFPIS